jgi:hypothetical protein
MTTGNISGLLRPDHTVPYGTVLSRGNIRGTSCQATIGLSLREKMCCSVIRILHVVLLCFSVGVFQSWLKAVAKCPGGTMRS